MIVFDLRCPQAHVFEAWFGSSAAFEDQRVRKLLVCPVCGDTDISKAVMAPNVAAKSNRSVAKFDALGAHTTSSSPSPEQVKAVLQVLAKAQAEVLRTSEWVGPAFAERARAMHVGEVATTSIHGQATLAEAKALVEEGVPIAPLPLPIVPPETIN